jgi:predicted dinucleotide-binding enzyme
MRIGVIGAGGLGGTLARQLAKLDHELLIANSRGPGSLAALAAEIGATPASIFEATKSADIVIVSIPTKAVTDLPSGLLTNLRDRDIVVDTCNYHPELRDNHIDAIDGGMLDSEWVAQQLGCPVIKAFNSIFAESLLEKGTPSGSMGRIALSVAGDASDARTTVLRLVDDLGFDPVDGGGRTGEHAGPTPHHVCRRRHRGRHCPPARSWRRTRGELEQYEDSYRLCYVRGPESIIVALAEQLS